VCGFQQLTFTIPILTTYKSSVASTEVTQVSYHFPITMGIQCHQPQQCKWQQRAVAIL